MRALRVEPKLPSACCKPCRSTSSGPGPPALRRASSRRRDGQRRSAKPRAVTMAGCPAKGPRRQQSLSSRTALSKASLQPPSAESSSEPWSKNSTTDPTIHAWRQILPCGTGPLCCTTSARMRTPRLKIGNEGGGSTFLVVLREYGQRLNAAWHCDRSGPPASARQGATVEQAPTSIGRQPGRGGPGRPGEPWPPPSKPQLGDSAWSPPPPPTLPTLPTLL